MDLTNRSSVQEFVLLGFGDGQPKKFLLLIFFTILYALTLAANGTIISLVLLDTKLSQLPMYILLSNFSWVEMCYVTTTAPRMISDLASLYGVISFHSCFLQFYLFVSLGTTETFFLSAMALDRYLAICHPLHYPQIMSKDSSYALVGACWLLGFLWYLLPIVMISRLSFCHSNIIDHFMCDWGPILALACPPFGYIPQICQIFMNSSILSNFLFVVLSYSVVILTLLKPSFQGSRRKAFSTIAFHLLVVTLFYAPVAAMYLTSAGESTSDLTKAIILFYTAVTPFLNPLIYCLRNDQVKEALQRLLRRKEIMLRTAKNRRRQW